MSSTIPIAVYDSADMGKNCIEKRKRNLDCFKQLITLDGDRPLRGTVGHMSQVTHVHVTHQPELASSRPDWTASTTFKKMSRECTGEADSGWIVLIGRRV